MINALQVKELREKTGAGMMDCKKALTETNGNFEEAIDWLRKKGLSQAAKKSDRLAAEGLTAVAYGNLRASAIELNSETDFVAKNKNFQNLVSEIANNSLSNFDLESLKSSKISSGMTIQELITENIATIGENLNLRRVASLSVSDGVVSTYVHNSEVPNMGKISCVVALESSGNKEELSKLGHKLAMHVAAAKPQYLSISDVSDAVIQKEKEIFAEQSRASGKPDNVIEKMIDGRIRKFFEEVVLLEQSFVIDGKTKISDVIKNASQQLGTSVELKGFIRFELGEGIENKNEKTFAEEVASITK